MITQTQTVDELLTQIRRMDTLEESGQVRDAMLSFKGHLSEDNYETIRKALSVRLNQLVTQEEYRIRAISQELNQEAYLDQNGNRYILDEWLTITNYAKKYGISTHVVTNAIRRGKIPADCVLELVRINYTRMVKDQPYK
jgi:DNA invertase Pin-like site-specific DNA recombinase